MNKGLFAHLVTTFICCLMTMYVIGSDDTTKCERAWVIVWFLFAHFITVAICEYNKFYKQKI